MCVKQDRCTARELRSGSLLFLRNQRARRAPLPAAFSAQALH